ncbi:MAG: STAS domain-containing protein [Ilumatobacteraceae bacterium]
MELMMRTSQIDGYEVLTACGEIDLATIPQLHNALVRHAHAHEGERVVIDLDGVSVCDDAGLGVLLGCAGRIRQAAGTMIVVCSDGPLRDRLARTGFDRAVDVRSCVAAAATLAPNGPHPTD